MRRTWCFSLMVVLAGLAAHVDASSPPGGRVRQARGQAQQPPQTTGASGSTGQTAAPGRGGRQGGQPVRPAVANAQMNDVQDVLDGMEISQVDRQLQLTDQQFGAFIPRLKRLLQLRRQHQAQRTRNFNQLRQLEKQDPAAEDQLIEAGTKRLDDFERQAFQELQAALGSIDEVLSVRQRARFRLFEENLERQKLEIITRVMGGPKGEPTPAPAPSKPIK